MNSKPCSVCRGQQVIQTPDQRLYQRCPICHGTGQQRTPLFRVYDLSQALTALQTNVQVVIPISDYDFEWQYLTAFSTGAFSALISDGGKNRDFSIDAAPRSCRRRIESRSRSLQTKRCVS